MRRALADLRAKADASRAACVPLSLPNTWNRLGVDLDRGAIERFIRALGIKHPVQVRWARFSERLGRRGDHLWNRGSHHRVRLDLSGRAEDVNRTLVHELYHAAQSESYGSDRAWADAYRRENERRGYDGNRFERVPGVRGRVRLGVAARLLSCATFGPRTAGAD